MTKAERAHLVRWARSVIEIARQEAAQEKTADFRMPHQLGHLQASLGLFADAIERDELPWSPDFIGPLESFTAYMDRRYEELVTQPRAERAAAGE